MKCIVQKYGGSSLSGVEKIQKVAEMIAQVRRNGTDVTVVVSAMGKTTNDLISMAKSITPNPERREMDMLLSTGERITMALLCMALHKMGIDAISLTGSQSGIITNDRHNDAQVIEVRPFRVQDEMAKGKVVVIGGFQGVSYKRDITTLGRGGSDTTAVALSAALNAERCEIYSDIDGVYTGDPNVVKDAKHLPEISYSVMQEMSTAGAKVLNAHAIQFAKEKQIALYARSTFDRGKETIVQRLDSQKLIGVQAVVSEDDLVRIRLYGKKSFENFQKIILLLEEECIPIKEVNATEAIDDAERSKVSFVVSSKNAYRWSAIQDMIQKTYGEKIQFDSSLSSLSLIGEGLNRDNKTLIETLRLLKARDISVVGVVTTSFRISLWVKMDDIRDSVMAAHDYWILEKKIIDSNT